MTPHMSPVTKRPTTHKQYGHCESAKTLDCANVLNINVGCTLYLSMHVAVVFAEEQRGSHCDVRTVA